MSKQETPATDRIVDLPRATPIADQQLQDRVILVTGAAQGFGRAISRACATAGATVIMLDKQLKALETLYDEIVAAGGPEPVIHPLNLEGVGPAEFLELATAIDQHFRRLDGLVHNAAFLGELSPMSQFDPEIWARVLHTNINAPFLLNQVCLPLLQRSDSARLIFISDAVGRQGKAFWGAYGASKAAAENMMETLALELGKGPVRVMSMDPGPMATAMRRHAYPAEGPDGQPAPETVAPWVVHLLGPEGAAYHGCRTRVPV
ncbi:MAG: SDR family NAD(P)-dependent oxidoreductase [Ectothiorhodospiraceae bacterium]|nr:SDR family NAD(P)-dependent oxidoreductase [Ectothiorhodospiraceae bacterium]